MATEAAQAIRWPRTARRVERVRAVLRRRQPDLTIVLEDVHDPHNASAVLRTCDAVGILRVHVVYQHEAPPRRAFSRTVSGSAAKWLQIERHRSIETCYEVLRRDGFAILATGLGDDSIELYQADLSGPVALVFGNEHRGVSPGGIAAADGMLKIPMIGMIQSLNISVACAVCLYEALRQRQTAGAFDHPKLDAETLADLERRWLKK